MGCDDWKLMSNVNALFSAVIESGAGGLLAGVLGIWLFTRRQDGKTRLGHGLSRAARLFGKRKD